MRKTLAFVCLFLALMTAVCAVAEIRYVENPGAWNERLNLRTEPDKGAPSLGRYYSGVRVRVLEDLGEWSRVAIACGRGSGVQGYMMSSYLHAPGGYSSAACMPHAWIAAETCEMVDVRGVRVRDLVMDEEVYVMAFCSGRLHVLTMDGVTGYIPEDAIAGELEEPEPDERIVREPIAVASGGAALRKKPGGDVIAYLSGGLFLPDAMLLSRGGAALVGVGDEEDALRGFISAGGYTWTDNGADCEEQYDIYETEDALIEVIGHTADGRLILRRWSSVFGDPAVEISETGVPQGARLLERSGSYYVYHTRLNSAADEQALFERAEKMARREGLFDGTAEEAGLSMRVVRLFDFQYGHAMLFVEFVTRDGQVVQQAEFDPIGGDMIAFGANG